MINKEINIIGGGCAGLSLARFSNLLPKYDESASTFVEPYLPNYKIGIMHLAAGIWDGDRDMRLDKEVKIQINSLQNNSLSKSLRFGQ